MRPDRLLAMLLGAAGLAGCDTINGLIRSAYVPVMPAPAAVLAAVRGAPGVDSAEYVPNNFTREVQSPDVVVTVVYRGRADVDGILQFIRDPGSPGRVQYSQNVTRMNAAPPQGEVDATYPVMLAIEARLEALPGLTHLRDAVVQECRGVRCPPGPGR